MSDSPLISPLLDGFALGNPISEHDGVRCCPAIKENSDKKYIVKIISIPATQVQVDAMLLAGAFKKPEDMMEYFKQVGEDVMQEAQFLKDISRLEGFLPYDGWQMEPITKKRVGYEVYLIGSYKHSLEKYVRRNPVTHLEAVNLGLDLCSALSVCRQSGSIYVDLKPSNIFVSEKKEYRIGDLGFIPLSALKYTALPTKYCSKYTPPELHDPMASVNLTADTYAVGIILYQLYNEGTLPFRDKAPQEPLDNPVNADYELAEIIMKAIHPDPLQRWQDPGEMGQALVSYMQRNAVNDVPITPYTPLDVDAQDVRLPREEEPLDEAAVPTEPQILPESQTEPTPEEQTEFPEEQPEAEEPAEPDSTVGEPEAAAEPAEESEPETPAQQEPAENLPEVTEPAEIPVSPVPAAADEFSRIVAKANDLISHETPVGVVLPEIPEEADPFAFALEDSIEAEDLKTPFDPVMEPVAETPSKREKRMQKKFRSQERKRKIKRFLSYLLVLLILASIGIIGLWCYQYVYLQTVDSIRIEGEMDQLTVHVATSAEESLLTVTCSDNYGNSKSKTLSGGQAVFTDLQPNTLYKVELSIDGFHQLVGQTSEVFTTDSTTNIVSFTSITGSEDGSVILNFTVDGKEPKHWAVNYYAEGEETQRETFTGHTITIDGLTVGKIYTFVLDAGQDLSLSGKTALDFMSSRLILAENLTATTTTGTDMTIRWTTPGDTIVESWTVRCYNDAGYDEQLTVTDTEVYLSNIDSSVAYNVEVTAAGMTQPARTSITANPLNITALNVDASEMDELVVSWEFSGTTPKEGWLLMYNIDGNNDLNVVKCDKPKATITPKIPNATYQFTIQSVDGTSIFGNVHSYTCPNAEPMKENGLSAENVTLSTVKTPEEKNWHYDSLGSSAVTDQFTLGDKISLVAHASTDFYLPGSELKILYVIRDAYGYVLPDSVSEEDTYWNNIWYGGNYHYAELDIPNIPEKAGTYTLNLYFNGASVGETTFTISE